jgi:large subunit ribosomal protein LX
MKAFRAIGAYRVKKGEYRNDLQEFKVEVAAKDEKAAAEKIVSSFGSRHRVGRKNIMIKELVPLKEEEITDPVVKHQVGGAK